MTIQEQIKAYITSQPDLKRSELETLHQTIMQINPACKLWFLDGKNSEGKIVSNPNIGYGEQIMQTTDGKSRPFYKVGLSANTTGISVYIMGIDDKTYLAKTFGSSLGKASVTGYCIKFKKLKDVHLETLKAAIQFGLNYEK